MPDEAIGLQIASGWEEHPAILRNFLSLRGRLLPEAVSQVDGKSDCFGKNRLAMTLGISVFLPDRRAPGAVEILAMTLNNSVVNGL